MQQRLKLRQICVSIGHKFVLFSIINIYIFGSKSQQSQACVRTFSFYSRFKNKFPRIKVKWQAFISWRLIVAYLLWTQSLLPTTKIQMTRCTPNEIILSVSGLPKNYYNCVRFQNRLRKNVMKRSTWYLALMQQGDGWWHGGWSWWHWWYCWIASHAVQP